MPTSSTRVGPDDAPAEVSQEDALRNSGSKHPAAEKRTSAGSVQKKKARHLAPTGNTQTAAGSQIFPKAIKVLILHRTLWCNCEECTAALKLVCEHCQEGGGILQHKEVDRVIQKARGDGESMRQLLTSPRVIIAIHPDALAGALPLVCCTRSSSRPDLQHQTAALSQRPASSALRRPRTR
jgi:hypothetical protein